MVKLERCGKRGGLFMATIVVVLAIAGLFASLTTATLGVGGGLLVMPMLALFFPARLIIAATLPMFLANAIVTFWIYRRTFRTRRVLWVLPGIIIGIMGGTGIVAHLSEELLRMVIGGVAVFFLLFTVLGGVLLKKQAAFPVWVGVPLSLVAGVVSTLSNIGGTLLSPYVLSENAPPVYFVGGMSFLYLVMTALKMVTFSLTGLLHWSEIGMAVPSILTIILGARTGQYLHKKINVRYFRWVVLGVVAVSSILLLVSP
ncbi:MAG: hypothetical protein C7B44_03055 [Sulfobacillus thermosulfidooxidans]|nr:MAG: hypothetical protein C7B44_03055 [Sulfobacillus thermosulfidooxidans]